MDGEKREKRKRQKKESIKNILFRPSQRPSVNLIKGGRMKSEEEKCIRGKLKKENVKYELEKLKREKFGVVSKEENN